ncbi:MAG: hypothetical protein ACLSE6_06385, partial [Alphaproteobacteria bacterium]
AGAEVCYSGSLKKFSECKEVCDPCPYTDNGGNPPFDNYQYIYTGTTNCGESCYGWCITSGTERYSTGCSCISDGNGGYSLRVGQYTEYYTNDVYEKTEDTSYTYSSYTSSSACERDIEEYSGYGHMCSGGPVGGGSHRSCW